jgi:hypothetical protein
MKIGDVPGGFPDFGVHQYSGVHTDDIFPTGNHIMPPQILDMTLKFDAERAIIPGTAQPAINITGLKDDAAPFT